MSKLIEQFNNKWRQHKDSGFIKPLCHIDDISELVIKALTNQRKEIDEALTLYQQEYANTKMSERPNGWTVLEDIKKINETTNPQH